jgi:HD-GYP domain-containing protein (c-di-GMP phosphodiesterase class II)
MRIAQVARDAAFQQMLGGAERAASVVGRRAGHAFDPDVVGALSEEGPELFTVDDASSWPETLGREPRPHSFLEGESIDGALSAIGDFSDLVSPYLVGHSIAVATLARNAAQRCGFDAADVATIGQAALVHDIGRVAVPAHMAQHAR